MKILLLGLALGLSFLVAACGGFVFTAANAPAWFGDFERRADVAYGTHERQRLDIYSPCGAGPKPIVVFWYGGSWEKGRKEQYRFVGAALAEAGYVAVLPDYRLYPEVRFPGFIDDGAAALAWVVSHAAEIGGDRRRIYVAGHSAGAHIAAMLAYDAPRLDAVGLPRDAIRGYIGLSAPYALDPNDDTLRTIFSAPFVHADWQPVQRAQSGAPPALLIHGDADTVVSVNHARRMAERLGVLGIAVDLRIFPGRGHADTIAPFAKAAPRKLPVLAEIDRFVAKTSAAP
ncbi:MAG: alpha/beta hydrolase [Steroidobacteraceae bacterium]|nr:alpha/beta hydrolase [Steroidobacteraceae bacterium]